MNIFELIERRTIASWRLRLANRWLTRSGLGTVLDNANGALVPQAVDLRNLYKNVISRRPSVILEFGVGHSTIVMAEALREVGGQIFTIDANLDWLNLFSSQVPERLKPIIKTYYCPLERMSHDGDECHRYVGLPDVTPDLVYLDGPDPCDVPDWGNDNSPIAADPILLEHKFPPGMRMIVDTRLANCEFLDRHLTRGYKKSYDKIFKIVTYDFI